jgi:hypothetical protein
VSTEPNDSSWAGSVRRWLPAWHFAFGLVATWFAIDYLRRGAELATRGETVKGLVWAVIAVAMIVPDLVGWLRRRARRG